MTIIQNSTVKLYSLQKIRSYISHFSNLLRREGASKSTEGRIANAKTLTSSIFLRSHEKCRFHGLLTILARLQTIRVWCKHSLTSNSSKELDHSPQNAPSGFCTTKPEVCPIGMNDSSGTGLTESYSPSIHAWPKTGGSRAKASCALCKVTGKVGEETYPGRASNGVSWSKSPNWHVGDAPFRLCCHKKLKACFRFDQH